jgi:hypothetical protein
VEKAEPEEEEGKVDVELVCASARLLEAVVSLAK